MSANPSLAEIGVGMGDGPVENMQSPTEQPEDGGNVRNRVIGEGPPELGSWVRFDLPVKSDFEQRWGTVPANYRQLRIMFAVRWDDKEEGAPLHADVYYDDLFFGFEDLQDSQSPSAPQR